MSRPPARRASFVPRIERLDDRITPAGVVTTNFTAGVLTITGVNNADPNLNHQRIALLGASQGHVSIAALDNEIIQGRNSFNRVQRVVMDLRGGDDTVYIVDLKMARATNVVRFNGGAGENTLFFDGLNINIGNLVVTNGPGGKLNLSPSESVKQSFGNITINCPDSECDILLGGMGVRGRTAVITGTTTNDRVQIDNAIFKGRVNIQTGGGSDIVEMGRIKPEDKEEVTFEGTVVINLGNGDDFLIAGMDVHDYPVDQPPDFVRFHGMTFINGGNGTDTATLHHGQSTEFTREDYPVLDNWENFVYVP